MYLLQPCASDETSGTAVAASSRRSRRETPSEQGQTGRNAFQCLRGLISYVVLDHAQDLVALRSPQELFRGRSSESAKPLTRFMSSSQSSMRETRQTHNVMSHFFLVPNTSTPSTLKCFTGKWSSHSLQDDLLNNAYSSFVTSSDFLALAGLLISRRPSSSFSPRLPRNHSPPFPLTSQRTTHWENL